MKKLILMALFLLLAGTALWAQEVQKIEITVGPYSFSPQTIRVKAGIPVEWSITGRGVSGCTNAIIIPAMKARIPIREGETRTVRFSANNPGTLNYSCWMGMVHGRIIIEEA